MATAWPGPTRGRFVHGSDGHHLSPIRAKGGVGITAASCRRRAATSAPAASHTRAVWSSPAVTTRRPSGLKHRPHNALVPQRRGKGLNRWWRPKCRAVWSFDRGQQPPTIRAQHDDMSLVTQLRSARAGDEEPHLVWCRRPGSGRSRRARPGDARWTWPLAAVRAEDRVTTLRRRAAEGGGQGLARDRVPDARRLVHAGRDQRCRQG